jgi:aspartate aminotransferase-like enzyme
MTPGPTPVPPQVLAAMAQPVVHHRGPDFRVVYERCLARLREVCRTASDVLLLTASGTAGMESCVANLCSPGDRVVVVSAGYFGERWSAIARAYGCDVHELRYTWGEAPSADDLAARLDELGGAHVVYLTHSETSTGVVADVQALAAVSSGSAPRLEIASTATSAPACFATAASAWTSATTPVEVSEWVR